MPSYQWIKQNQREQIGQLIKKMIKNSSDVHLGYWHEELKAAREGITTDGKFSKDGILWLDRLASLEKMLISEGLTTDLKNRAYIDKTRQEDQPKKVVKSRFARDDFNMNKTGQEDH